jgi:hypothetical protein
MTENEAAALRKEAARLREVVQGLRTAVFSQTDPSADDALLDRLGAEETHLRETEEELAAAPEPPPKEPPPEDRPRLLGPETTELKVETTIHLQPVPTGIYHLLDPQMHPLLTVTVANLSMDARRVRVTAFIEGLSARAVRTMELGGKARASATATFPLHPTLLPERAREVTDVQWATLHVIVDLLGATREGQSQIPELCECHNTFPVLCLARTSGFNAVRRPEDGSLVDLTRYYGAWVTPHVEPVQQRIRRAVELSKDRAIWGQRDRDSVERQVSCTYESLRELDLAYVNSVIDYGAATGQLTQRTRLPRESLAQKSANCIDGTVLMASMLEGASLNPAIVLVPQHAFLAWETAHRSGEWSYLETTMIGSADFAAACASGKKQYDKFRVFYPGKIRRHALADLRSAGIYPME